MTEEVRTPYPTTKFPELEEGVFNWVNEEKIDDWFKRAIADFPIDDTFTYTPGRQHWAFYLWREKWLSQLMETEE